MILCFTASLRKSAMHPSQPLGIDLVLGEFTENVNLRPLHLLQKHAKIRFLGQLPLDGTIAVSVHQMRTTSDKKYGSCGSGLGGGEKDTFPLDDL